MQLHDVGPGVLDHPSHDGATEPATPRRLAHVHAPEQPLVPLLGSLRHGEPGNREQSAVCQGAEHRLAFQAGSDLDQTVACLLVMARRESPGVGRESLEAQRLECRRVVGAESSHLPARRHLS